MFRRLREVYERLGVTSRTEAIMVAERLGLFDQD
jgi:DNA-binding NarL/FixJ family response regulator